ncbi:hypothetical protein J6590_067869 [Homalodisca vitripennis]|nr:hypothetical protein J6590_067869 [Homalodisca vitripennis]
MNGTEAPSFASAALMFNWVEYSVFCSMLLLSLLVGVYFGYFQKQDTVAEYLLGGRTMGVLPIALSQVFSHVSGVSLVGLPAEIYVFGSQYAVIFLPITVTVLLVNYVYLPVFYHLQLNSLYEYLELRFSRGTRTLGSLIFALNLVISAPLVIYVPALAFNQVTGLDVHIVTPIVMLICIFYTSIGGLKAVVWTDAIQGVFTLGSNFFVVGLGFMYVGGIMQVLRTNEEGGRLELFK